MTPHTPSLIELKDKSFYWIKCFSYSSWEIGRYSTELGCFKFTDGSKIQSVYEIGEEVNKQRKKGILEGVYDNIKDLPKQQGQSAEWSLVSHLQKPNDCFIHIGGPEGGPVLEFKKGWHDMTPEEQDSALRIIKAVNMHDKFIDGLYEAKRILGELSGKDCEAINFSQEFLYGSYQKFKSLLKQAESK